MRFNLDQKNWISLALFMEKHTLLLVIRVQVNLADVVLHHVHVVGIALVHFKGIISHSHYLQWDECDICGPDIFGLDSCHPLLIKLEPLIEFTWVNK